MDRRTALSAALALTLTVTGGVSALFLTLGSGQSALAEPAPAPIATTYVDQYGNPIPDPNSALAPVPTAASTASDYAEASAPPIAGQPVSQAASVDYAEGEHDDEEGAEYPEDDHTEDDHTGDDHAEDDHAEDDHAEDDHAGDDHAEDHYEDEDTDGQYPESEDD